MSAPSSSSTACSCKSVSCLACFPCLFCKSTLSVCRDHISFVGAAGRLAVQPSPRPVSSPAVARNGSGPVSVSSSSPVVAGNDSGPVSVSSSPSLSLSSPSSSVYTSPSPSLYISSSPSLYTLSSLSSPPTSWNDIMERTTIMEQLGLDMDDIEPEPIPIAYDYDMEDDDYAYQQDTTFYDLDGNILGNPGGYDPFSDTDFDSDSDSQDHRQLPPPTPMRRRASTPFRRPAIIESSSEEETIDTVPEDDDKATEETATIPQDQGEFQARQVRCSWWVGDVFEAMEEDKENVDPEPRPPVVLWLSDSEDSEVEFNWEDESEWDSSDDEHNTPVFVGGGSVFTGQEDIDIDDNKENVPPTYDIENFIEEADTNDIDEVVEPTAKEPKEPRKRTRKTYGPARWARANGRLVRV
ncbi:uncharacterized protein EV422DRAFT_617189 [Fimicolochytrium jonesii]|uniref:uncharacterized protein n=1 Tax=Fimicolochytrium jonesii TaxID=1396493 RepID=UPI0022FE8104|nr:uncharacterized protein EV422DRAFT_617189 [Fimicolochytrium jonesii]KAI8826215.1 hypothetical protein EV422DRAFT_617189 [Fimicolochytrium jonesii]